jgi:hypothetical protein
MSMKNAFDWRGEPSIWSRDRELQNILQGQNWGRKTQAKINPNEKREITTYSRAKLKEKSSG